MSICERRHRSCYSRELNAKDVHITAAVSVRLSNHYKTQAIIL